MFDIATLQYMFNITVLTCKQFQRFHWKLSTYVQASKGVVPNDYIEICFPRCTELKVYIEKLRTHIIPKTSKCVVANDYIGIFCQHCTSPGTQGELQVLAPVSIDCSIDSIKCIISLSSIIIGISQICFIVVIYLVKGNGLYTRFIRTLFTDCSHFLVIISK